MGARETSRARLNSAYKGFIGNVSTDLRLTSPRLSSQGACFYPFPSPVCCGVAVTYRAPWLSADALPVARLADSCCRPKRRLLILAGRATAHYIPPLFPLRPKLYATLSGGPLFAACSTLPPAPALPFLGSAAFLFPARRLIHGAGQWVTRQPGP